LKHWITSDDERKRALLARLSEEGRELLLFCEELPAQPARSSALRPGVWGRTPPHDNDELERCLYEGNWQAISPALLDYQPFDTFRASAERINGVMQGLGLSILIDAFHDDIEWKISEASPETT